MVLKIYEKCVGENEACISTIDMLHHIGRIHQQKRDLCHRMHDFPKLIIYSYRGPNGDSDTGAGAASSTEGQTNKLQNENMVDEYDGGGQVELARVTCEKERRHREKEVSLASPQESPPGQARMEKQRLSEAQRNKAALDRSSKY